MAFDRKLAEGALVEILDALNGDRVLGMGVRLLGDVIATSCRCLPRPTGRPLLPDPDFPGVPVLARVRQPDSDLAAFGVVTYADPFSGLALVASSSAACPEIPEELNPVIRIGELVARMEPLAPEPAPGRGGPVLVCGRDRRWIEAEARGDTVAARSRADQQAGAVPGAPVLDADGRVVGLVSHAVAELELRMCRLAEHLPASLLRRSAPLQPRGIFSRSVASVVPGSDDR